MYIFSMQNSFEKRKNVCSQFCILRQYQWANFRKKQISAVQVPLHCLTIIKWLQYHSTTVKKCNTYTLWIALMSHLAASFINKTLYIFEGWSLDIESLVIRWIVHLKFTQRAAFVYMVTLPLSPYSMHLTR